MKERKSKSQTGAVLNYGQKDGRGGIVLLEEPGPNDVITTSFMRGRDGKLTKLDQPAKEDPQNTYANVFRHEAFPQIPYLTADRWAQVFASQGFTEQDSPGQYSELMGGLRPYGQMQMSGEDKGRIVSTYQEPKAKSAVKIIWDNIDQTPGFMINEEFFTADDAAKHIKANKKEFEENPPIIESVTKQTALHPTTGNPVNRYSSKKVVTEALLAAKKAENPDQGFTYTDPMSNDDITFFSYGDTDRERVRNDMEWIAGLVAEFEASGKEGSVTDKFNSAFEQPELAKLRRRMFNNIVFLTGIGTERGVTRDNDQIIQLAQGSLGAKYPAVIQIPGFEKFFFEGASGLKQNSIAEVSSKASSGEKPVTFTMPSGQPGIDIIIPAVLPTVDGNGDPTDSATAPYEGYVKWAANRFKSTTTAINLAGNLIKYGTPVDGKEKGTLYQPNLELLAEAAIKPSTQVLDGGKDEDGKQLPPITLTVLDTMYLNYAPGRQLGFSISGKEKETFARNLVYSPDAISYNEKLTLVNGFAPRMMPSKEGGNLQSLYSWKFLDTMKGEKFSEMQADQEIKQFSGQEAGSLIAKAQSTFFIPIQGPGGNVVGYEFVTTGTKLAEIGLNVRNIIEYTREFGAKALTKLLGIEEGSAIFKRLMGTVTNTAAMLSDGEAKNFIGDAIDAQVGQFGSILDASLTDDQIAAEAKRRGQTVNTFMEKEMEARANNAERLASIIDRLSSSDVEDRNIALRQYYKYMIAYRVAAAMQGGTGGRTISDQDVQNVLNFLRMDNLTSRAAEEYAILEDLKGEMLLMAQRGAALSASTDTKEGAQTVFNALILEDMRPTAGLRIEDLLLQKYSRPRQKTSGSSASSSSGAGDGSKKAVSKMSETEKLKIINENQAFITGEEYETLDAANKSLGTAKVNRILGLGQ